jgi:hypothetical protein
VIQLSLLTAVQLQPVVVVTLTLPVVAADPALCDVGDTVMLHVPFCVTVTV